MKISKLALLILAIITATTSLTNATGNNELINAIKKNNFTEAVVLLDKGMNPNVIEGNNSPLMLAARKGDFRFTRVLIAFGADVNLRNDDGTTALMIAARFGHTEVVDLLLREGADPNLRNSKGYTSADLARMFKHEETASRLRHTTMR
jgi:ankyrin repeat protein